MKKKDKQEGFHYHAKEIKRNKGLNDDYKTVISFIVVIVVIVILVVALFYFNGRFVTRDFFQDETTTTTTAATYDETLLTVKTMFGVSNSEYYVLLYDTNADDSFLYDSLASAYDNEDINLYTVDMSSAMNKAYYDPDGEENSKPKSSEDVVITRPTLIVFKKGRVSSYITDRDEIAKMLANRETEEE